MNMKESLSESKYDNYSKEDGSLKIKENINYITIEKESINNCPACGNKVRKKDIYCNNCGQILESIRSKREKFINLEGEKNKFKDIAFNFNLINCLKTVGLSIGILFVFSLIIKFIIVGDNNQISQLINPLHIMLFSNLANINIFMSLFMNSTQSSINFGLLILLILPIISLFFSYEIFMKKRNNSFMSHIKNSLGVATIYALILFVIAKVSQVQVSLSNGFNQYGYGIFFGFDALDVLFKGFIIAFISILFIGMKKEYTKENMIASILKMAIRTVFIGYLLVLTISIILYFANINYIVDLGLNSYTNNVSIGVVFSQLAIYLWAFANLIPISIGSRSISIVSLFNSSISLDLILLLGAMIALSALIFIIIGSKLESKYKSENLKPVIIFSGLYAIIIGLIGFMTTIYIGDNAASILTSLNAMQMGFNFIIGMIISFIYSLTMTLIGYKLNIFN